MENDEVDGLLVLWCYGVDEVGCICGSGGLASEVITGKYTSIYKKNLTIIILDGKNVVNRIRIVHFDINL
ncbi:hypothetical protein [Paenibacillus oryzisoli]|uniref:Uncharacterized protein n=1 Tax=Paenibacillus oryzisoli TaxID=1850517 RepID=A0A198A464_9BACL|nr:hypothetical protein [Paenibacillus oryzisoli]OAS16284.1 hypothetical protein A8708_19895 [Paenibacillus oryzisoli]